MRTIVTTINNPIRTGCDLMRLRVRVRVGFKTTLDEDLISQLKIKAIQEKVNVNDILEKLIEKYLKGETKIVIKK